MYRLFIVGLFLLAWLGCADTRQTGSRAESYEPTWESLGKYPVPEWFKDAKFGIYTHWGAYAVPAFGHEWYPRRMYIDGDHSRGNFLKYHQEHFGHQDEFGYKDFIPMFTGEKFDAEEWAELFKKAGAQFAGPVAEHHDGFAMWDTKYSEWNAVKMGPKRDVVGEMEQAIRKRGMKFVTSFHHAYNWQYYQVWRGKYDVADPAYEGLYGPMHGENERPNKEFIDEWHGKLIEVIDKYSPDLMWFDFGLEMLPESAIQDYLAYYYNHAVKNGKQVVVTYKDHDLPPGVGVVDLERGRMEKLTYHNWLTDTSIGWRSWGYIDGESFKDANVLIDVLVDIVSKDGCMLLSVGPRADGSIPEEAQKYLLDIGEWLKINGEAIYGTRPWVVYGEGPTKMEAGGGFNEDPDRQYTGEDIRYTVKGDALYAIALGWPGEQMTIRTAGGGNDAWERLDAGKITSITMLGDGRKLDWEQTEDGLVIQTPDQKPCENAFVFKIMR